MHASPSPAPRWIDPGRRAVVTVRGEDAVRFCDGFLTAALSRLPSDGGTEAFLLDAKGAVIAHVHAFRQADGLWLDAEGGTETGERIRDHLEHHHIRERLEVIERSDAFRHVVLVGSKEGSSLPGVPGTNDGILWAPLPWSSPDAVLMAIPSGRFEDVTERLEADGPTVVDADAWKRMRIAHGIPGEEDIVDRTLAQEFGRDTRAIALDKGCYLGQETVARLDALGHVNRRMVRLSVAGSVPPAPGTPCLSGDTNVGSVGSACVGLTDETWALAMISTRAIHTGVELSVARRRARIVPFEQGSDAP